MTKFLSYIPLILKTCTFPFKVLFCLHISYILFYYFVLPGTTVHVTNTTLNLDLALATMRNCLVAPMAEELYYHPCFEKWSWNHRNVQKSLCTPESLKWSTSWPVFSAWVESDRFTACCVILLCNSSDDCPMSVLLSQSACLLSHASHLQELLHTPVHSDLQLWQSARSSPVKAIICCNLVANSIV